MGGRGGTAGQASLPRQQRFSLHPHPFLPLLIQVSHLGLGMGGGGEAVLSTKKIMLGPREALSFWGDTRAPSPTLV